MREPSFSTFFRLETPENPIAVTSGESSIAVPVSGWNNLKENPLVSPLMTPTGLTLMGTLVLLGLLSLAGDGRKGKLASGYWGGRAETARAKARASKQIARPARDSVSGYIGTPGEILLKLKEEWVIRGLDSDSRQSAGKTVYLTDLQRGTAVIGAAGSGKTFTWLDPLARSMVDQGFPGVLFDCKFPSQASGIAAYALKRGYRVYYFCPGLGGSTCNLQDFIEHSRDAVSAGQLATVIARNIERGGMTGDKFFEDAGMTLLEASLLLAKAVGETAGPEYDDLLTAAEILSLPNLGNRLLHARESGRFNFWTTKPASQIISVRGSAETEASIVGTTQKYFGKFLKEGFVGSFIGETTLPIDLDGRTLVIFGMDRRNRDMVAPLIAGVMHAIVTRNLSRREPRSQPLWVSLDELPRLYLPELATWLSLNRSDGFVGLLGIQTEAQLREMYGEDTMKIILSNVSTKLFMNPNDLETAERIARWLGETDITYRTRSRSRNSGDKGGGGTSRSTSENRQAKALYAPERILKMGVGKTIVINPGYRRRDDEGVPFLLKNRLPGEDLREVEWSRSMWPALWERESERTPKLSEREMERLSRERYELVNALFPEPEKSSGEGGTAGANRADASPPLSNFGL